MTIDSSIQKTVMRRVKTIHALRAASGGAGVSVLVLIASLYLIGREVWVARVLQNMPSSAHIGENLRFIAGAFAHTEFAVQALTLLCAAAFLWLLREIARVLPTLLPASRGSF